MELWWESLNQMDKVLYYIAVPSSVALILQTVLTFIGMGDSGDFDSDVLDGTEFDGDFEISFQIFTIRNFIAFFTFFSWGGLWANSIASNSDFVVIILALLSGFMAMLMSSGLFYFMKKMAVSGTMNIKYAVGKIGEVYMPIPKEKSGSGKIQVIIQGALREVEAVSNSEFILETGSSVKVVALLNESVLIVEKNEKQKIY
ncbi:MAG: hypothetical protein WBA54_07900 [Acidaminobacteraceae bacterium]